YDISKKLGLENKEIISKAKSLGITAAKVASSSLDKISAEYLEGELLKDHPDLAAKFAAPAVEVARPAPVEEKIVVITAPPPEAAPARQEVGTGPAVATPEPPPVDVETEPRPEVPEPP